LPYTLSKSWKKSISFDTMTRPASPLSDCDAPTNAFVSVSMLSQP
jgi:hypothetical protein